MPVSHRLQPQSTLNVKPTQFALVRLDRLVYLVQHYESLRIDAEALPPAPHRPPLSYVEATLSELRRELHLREGEGVAA
jgi:hypothetical protein